MISDAIKKMQAMARKAQEETYDGKCTVTEFQPIKDPKTKITSEKEVVVLEDEPCRLSYSNVSAISGSSSSFLLSYFFCCCKHRFYRSNFISFPQGLYPV